MSRKKQIPDFDNTYVLSADASDKRFGKIYEGMLKSSNWQRLKPCARVLLIISIVHTATADNYKELYAYCESQGMHDKYKGHGYFMLPKEKLEAYGFDSSHASRHFKQLVNEGFIKCIEKNQHRKLPNVYQLSGEWKNHKNV